MKKIFKIYALLVVVISVFPFFCIDSFAQTAGEVHEGGNVWRVIADNSHWELINGNWYRLNTPGEGDDPSGDDENEIPESGGPPNVPIGNNDQEDPWNQVDWADYWGGDWDYWDWADYWNEFGGGGGNGPNNPNLGPPFTCPELKSRTTKEPNKERTILGLGEEFSINVVNFCPGSRVSWQILNSDGAEGIITLPDPPNDPQEFGYAIFEAGYKPGKFTVRASFQWAGKCADEGCPETLEMEFTVIAPEGVAYQITGEEGCAEYHEYKVPSGGFDARIYLTPNTVNFSHLQFKEGETINNCDGDYWAQPGFQDGCYPHEPSDWASMKNEVTPLGTLVRLPDHVRFLWRWDLTCTNPNVGPKGDASLSGFKQWTIKCYYRKDELLSNDQGVEFTTVIQRGDNLGGANSIFIMKKGTPPDNTGGVSFSTRLTDPDICSELPIGAKCDN